MANRPTTMHEKLNERSKGHKKLEPANLARARKFRSSGEWQRLSKLHLMTNPLCSDPMKDHAKNGDIVAGKQTHHVKGVATHWDLRKNRGNLRSICFKCHDYIEKRLRQGVDLSYLFKK